MTVQIDIVTALVVAGVCAGLFSGSGLVGTGIFAALYVLMPYKVRS